MLQNLADRVQPICKNLLSRNHLPIPN